jgi:uncharacterized protein with NRDE domain
MCLLLALRPGGNEPVLWVAANRDERIDRPWRAPELLCESPRVFGGRDLVGGGSWLAVNLDAAYLVAVTNARLGAPAGDRSRGELVVAAAAQESFADAVALLTELQLHHYGPFNLLIADPTRVLLATNHPGPRLLEEADAVVAVGNESLAERGERVLMAAEAARRALGRGSDLGGSLTATLADHGGADPVCRHGERYGTVSSVVLTLGSAGLGRYDFAAGPPCRTPFVTLVAGPRGA